VEGIILNPPKELREEECPAWPYGPKFRAIHEEADAIEAVRDQVGKLPPEIDRESLSPFYRLLWILNDGPLHKTFQGYLGFSEREREDGQACFFSEILLNPLNHESKFIIDLPKVKALSLQIVSKLTVTADRSDSRVVLTPIKTKFGSPPAPQWGYALGMKNEGFGGTRMSAFEAWRTGIDSMLPALSTKR
jgi:hypothetical protein